jgi:hypothetical protein
VGAFVVAVLICAVIVGCVAAPPQIPWTKFGESGEFWMTGLPAWLHGLWTVAAAYLAFWALRVWRQEVEKTPSLLAREVLRRAWSGSEKVGSTECTVA